MRVSAAVTMGVALVGAKLPAVGSPAPDTVITLYDGTRVRLHDLRGQVVILNYWATWCAPCLRELPLLDRYHQILKDHGLRVYAVTTRDSLSAYQLRKVFAAMSITPAKAIGDPYAGPRALPMNYVIDRAGRLRYARAGAFDLDTLNREIGPLVAEAAPAT